MVHRQSVRVCHVHVCDFGSSPLVFFMGWYRNYHTFRHLAVSMSPGLLVNAEVHPPPSTSRKLPKSHTVVELFRRDEQFVSFGAQGGDRIEVRSVARGQPASQRRNHSQQGRGECQCNWVIRLEAEEHSAG
jgi:hypothetical protein